VRNNYPGKCYRCGERVEPGEGHFERMGRHWRVQHAECAIKFRGMPDHERQAFQIDKWKKMARMTGRRAQRARKRLKEMGVPWE